MYGYTDETKKVFEIISEYQPIRLIDISLKLGVSKKNLYTHLNRLLEDDLIKKEGSVPKVYYSVVTEESFIMDAPNPNDLVIEQNYIYVSPSGEMIKGVKGFQAWCSKNKFNFENEKKKFVNKLKDVNSIKKNGVISAKKIILSGKKELYLDNIFFSDFYTLDYFGKTKLGQLVYVGKSSQNKELISEIAEIVKPSILKLIEKYNIELLSFIPPTIDRKVQFVDTLKKKLNFQLPILSVDKVPSATKIPQKSLRKLEDRIFNAQKTIAVNLGKEINGNVLIIDDATGSGATLNETAKKIRKIAGKKIKIIGYSIVGSYKGFDVISEV